MSAHLVYIEQLPHLLQQLESCLTIKFDALVVAHIIADAEDDSPLNMDKEYTLYKSSTCWFPWKITGMVEQDEPETIWLESYNGGSKQQAFDAFFKATGH